MKDLPIGIQTFRKIIDGGYIYADKTRYIYNLLKGTNCYFLSRPRRFGKSLLLDTIAEALSGDKGLFRGLWIYDSDYDFKKYPVIRLDMTQMETGSADALKESLYDQINEYIEGENFQISTKLLARRFRSLILSLHRKYGERVAVLVDEYDIPVLDHITEIETAEANRTVIKNFFRVLKGLDAHLHFVFFTSVSKFTRTSLFSELNNLQDITMSNDYANICGFTHTDLTELFSGHLKAMNGIGILPPLSEWGADSIREQIYNWYDGYSWDGETRVFNPFSLLNFFKAKRFKAYWFESGSPGFLIKLIRQDPANYRNADGAVMNEAALDAMDIGSLSAVSLMFQTGYLTIGKIEQQINRLARYTLVTPNLEVRAAFSILFDMPY